MTWQVVAVVRNPLGKKPAKGDTIMFSVMGTAETEAEAKAMARDKACTLHRDGFFASPEAPLLLIMAHEVHSIMVKEVVE